jgi:hypothetical protein
MPAFNICSSNHHFVRKEFFNIIFKNDSNSRIDNTTKIANYLNKLSIKDQFRALQSAQEIIEKCRVMKTKGFNLTNNCLHCYEISAIRMSINYYTLCFTILSQVNGEQDDKYSIYMNKDMNKYFLLTVGIPNNINTKTMYLMIQI